MLVRRVARWGGMGHHDPLTTPGRGISGEQALDVEPSLSPSAVSAGPAQRKRKAQRF